MTKDKALAILLQPDRIGCHLIKANDEESNKYNQESIEALNMAIESINKLEKIEHIIDDCDLEAWEVLEKIKEILEKE